MPEITEADRYLLQQILAGNAEGWGQLVDRYQGRLLAFARGRLARREEAEDLVQDTFIAFLESLKRFRETASIETYLFTILRRKLIDVFRGSKFRPCLLSESIESDEDSSAAEVLSSGDLSASQYIARSDGQNQLKEDLAAALGAHIDRLKAAENFRDLQILEMLLYAQLRNKEAAKLLDMDEKQIALIKHRSLNEIRDYVTARRVQIPSSRPGADVEIETASLLSEVWEDTRPTCPKRSTIGRSLLGTLEREWKAYIDFHINKLGCRFCKANLEDLKKQTQTEPDQLRFKVLQSTIGFFKK
jgi:RNA polymerase sigma factor (sigma-70 family)